MADAEAAADPDRRTHHPVIDGPFSERDIPVCPVSKLTTETIPREFVRPGWLEAHSKQDVPSRVRTDPVDVSRHLRAVEITLAL